MRSVKRFHLGDIVSVTSGRLVSPRRIDGVYDVLNHMTGDNLYTHQLPQAGRECKPYLLRQFPFLDSPEMQFEIGKLILMLESPSGKERPSDLVTGWLSQQVAKWGEYFEVETISMDDHRTVDPLTELREMVGHKPIIVVSE